MKLYEQKNGQYSLFDVSEEDIKPDLINSTTKKLIYDIELLINKYASVEEQYKIIIKKEVLNFINYFLNIFDSFSSDELSQCYDEERKWIKRIAKIFSFYLTEFVYKVDITHELDSEDIIKIEAFLKSIPFNLKDEAVNNTLNNINTRDTLKADNYIIIYLKPIVDKLNRLLEINLNTMRANTINDLANDRRFQNLLNNPSIIDENNFQIFAMALIYYYESTPSPKIKKIIENYIVTHYPQDFIINEKQQLLIDNVLNNMALRVGEYAQQKFPLIEKMLADYDFVHQKREKKIITSPDDICFAESKDKIKEELEKFINLVFLPRENLKLSQLPISRLEDKTPLNNSCILILEYLQRFIYSEEVSISPQLVAALEDYVITNEFLTLIKADHCVTKALVYQKSIFRNISQDKKLQSNKK